MDFSGWFWKGCKPNFVCTSRWRESFVSATNTRNPSAFAALERAAPGFPIWPCTRRGFPCRVACASRGARLPHLFTITDCSGGLRPPLADAHRAPLQFRLYVFCGTVRRNTSRSSARVYPSRTDLGYAASRPMEFGLSSPGSHRERFSTLPKPTIA